MKKARFKIAALVGGSVLLTLLIILVLFQIISSRQTEKLAKEAIQAYTELTYGETSSMQYSPAVIEMPEGLEGTPNIEYFYTPQELKIIEWCRAHNPEEIEKVKINSRTYYIGIGSTEVDDMVTSLIGVLEDTNEEVSRILELFPFLNSRGPVTTIVYVDITAELATTRKMCLFFLIAAVVIGIIGSFEGYLIGRKLELSSRAEKQFFENTSHELKTPLTSIRGYAEGIEKGVITDNQKSGQVIARETEKMSRLIEDILLSAKLESGAMPIKKEPLQLEQLVEECLMPMEGAVLSRGLQVNLMLDPETVSADPDRLEHAVSNLITNAVKYAKSRLSITLHDKTLIIQNDCDPLTDEELKHLFDRFYTGRNGNTGIGLSIARDIINLHGWKLRAEKTEDGIRFITNIK